MPSVLAVPHSDRFQASANGYFPLMGTLLWILAVILVVAGIFAIVRRQLIWGIVLGAGVHTARMLATRATSRRSSRTDGTSA